MGVSPTNGNGPTQGQRKTLTRVGPSSPISSVDLESFIYRKLFVTPIKLHYEGWGWEGEWLKCGQ